MGENHTNSSLLSSFAKHKPGHRHACENIRPNINYNEKNGKTMADADWAYLRPSTSDPRAGKRKRDLTTGGIGLA